MPKVRSIMLSGVKRDELKRLAIALRERGDSYPVIERNLGVGRSTLSGWLRTLVLSSKARRIILERKQAHLKLARKKAEFSHRSTREAEVKKITQEVINDFANLRFDTRVKEALLAMLYLGEGFKRRSVVALGNSNPRLLASFVELLREIYQVPDSKLSCFLYLRDDQNDDKEKKYWSGTLRIDISRFRKSQKDKRTLGKKTWKGYHGVCAVYCYDARMEKRLTALQDVLLEKLLTGL